MSQEHAGTVYADRAVQHRVSVVENVPLARDTYRIRFECPPIARQIVPGQFIMMRLAGCNDPLLGRPLALYDVVRGAAGQAVAIDIVYQAVGKMTRRLAGVQAGTALEVWGPLGNGFPPTPGQHLVMVAGGIGQTPFLTLAKEHLGRDRYGEPPRHVSAARKVTLCYGCRSAEYLACVEDFRRSGVDVRLSTDDGSAGRRGLVTELIGPVVEESEFPCRLVACGPEAMLAATATLAGQLGLPCHVSLETPMACGLGICFSCVAKVRDRAGHWDYRRTCVEGPVFDARDVEFEPRA
jgi:dihydroorotate dehydrogenase electron transfer subunit